MRFKLDENLGHSPSDVVAAVAMLLEATASHDVTGNLWVVARGRVRRFLPRAEE